MMRFGVESLERTGFTMNLSISGAFIRTNHVLRPGTLLQTEIEFPQEKISVWAQVVWAKRVPMELAHLLPCGMGVRFINPGPEWERLFNVWNSGKS